MALDGEHTRLLTRAALLYYRDGLTQAEVAGRLGVSRPTAGRLLSRAREAGVVRIEIDSPLRSATELEVAIEKMFGLREAVVIESESRSELGRAGAELLGRRLASGSVVGVGWSRTVRETADSFRPRGIDGVTIVQLDGAWTSGEYRTHADHILATLASRLSGTSVALPAPLYVDQPATARRLMSDTSIRTALDLADRADICVFGIGDLSTSTTLVLGGFVDERQVSDLAAAGAVGDVCGRFFDDSGTPIGGQLADRTISLPLPRLRQCPLRIAVAGGPTKVDAIRAALRGNLANALVTDAATASTLTT